MKLERPPCRSKPQPISMTIQAAPEAKEKALHRLSAFRWWPQLRAERRGLGRVATAYVATEGLAEWLLGT